MKFSEQRIVAQVEARRQIVARMSPAARDRLSDGRSKIISPSFISEAEFFIFTKNNEISALKFIMVTELIALIREP